MDLPIDYPRINQFPEWFTVDAETEYTIDTGNRHVINLTGAELSKGLPIELKERQRLRVIVVSLAGSEERTRSSAVGVRAEKGCGSP